MGVSAFDTLTLLMLAGLLFVVIVQMLRLSFLEGRIDKHREAIESCLKLLALHQTAIDEGRRQAIQEKQGVRWTKPTLIHPIGDVEKGD